MTENIKKVEKLGPQDSELLNEYSGVHMNVFGTPLRVLDHGKGSRVWDVDGNSYLDFLAGIAVNSLGYAHPAWVKAVSAQAGTLVHTSNYFATQPQIKLAEKLVEKAGAPAGSKVYFGNSGTEGNEAALKLAKLHGNALEAQATGSQKGLNSRIIAMTHSFHGRTLGALSVTWKPVIRTPFEPLLPDTQFVEASNIEALTAAFNSTDEQGKAQGPVAAVIMELIQGEAGVLPIGAEFVKAARRLCDEHSTLLIIDEVQTGMGRTGHWFAFQDETLSGGVMPDAITFAKGVASGFPMGGLITFGTKVSNYFTPGSHGSTFAGNPLGAAAGLATIETIDAEKLLENTVARGEQLREGLMQSQNPLFAAVRGAGLLNAIQLAHPCSHAVADWALSHGLIVNAVAPDAIRLAPPLVITEQEIEEGVNILADVPCDLVDD